MIHVESIQIPFSKEGGEEKQVQKTERGKVGSGCVRK